MPFALLLGLSAAAGGTLLTYLYDRDAPFFARVCAGLCTGFAALTLVGFVLASFVGLNLFSLLIAGLLVASPLVLLRRVELRAEVRGEVRGASRWLRRALTLREGAVQLAFYVAALTLCWMVFAQAMYETPEGIFTGIDNNIGDLPFHVGIITGFVHGENFPPEHPEFAGARLTYPFLADFLTALFVRAGASLEGAMFWQNFLLALSFIGLLHRWARELTGDRLAALLVPAIVLFNGGLGFVGFFREAAAKGGGLFEALGNLTRYYTMSGDAYKWGNAVVMLLAPQRGLLLGFPLAMVVWTLWWKAAIGVGGRGLGAGEEGDEVSGKRKGDERKREKSTRRQKARNDAARNKTAGGAQKKNEGHAQLNSARQEGAQLDSAQIKRAESKSARLKGKAARANTSTPAPGPRPPTPAFRPLTSFLPLLAAGVIAGLMPLVHAHSFVVLMSMGACVAVLFCLRWPWVDVEGKGGRAFLLPCWRGWAAFFGAAMLVAVPQMLWATYKSDVQAASFFGWHLGWDRGEQSTVVFWMKNTGVFIPLLAAAVTWRGARPLVPRRLLLFLAPFALCFVVPNLFKLSPWIWDNIKILFYWWIASAPLVALVLARLWRSGVAARVGAVVLFVALTLAGALDVWRVASGAMRQVVFTNGGVAFAELVKRETAPRSLILHAPTYNHPVYLTGRRALMGYAGHLGSHGLDFAQRERDLARIYLGTAEADALLKKYNVNYVVVGPLERQGGDMTRIGARVNESFFQRYTKVGEAGGYSLYKTTP